MAMTEANFPPKQLCAQTAATCKVGNSQSNGPSSWYKTLNNYVINLFGLHEWYSLSCGVMLVMSTINSYVFLFYFILF